MVSIDYSCQKCLDRWPTECSECPECAGRYCQSCADDFLQICPCGGELQKDKYFELCCSDKLPDEIVQHKSLKDRINALNQIRPLYNLIEAEYNYYKYIIIECEKDARAYRTEVQDNLGYRLLTNKQSWPSGSMASYDKEDVVHTLIDHVVPSNVELLLSLISGEFYLEKIHDEFFMEYLIELVHDAPRTETEWKKFKQDWKLISVVGDAVFIPEDGEAKCFESYRDSIELLRKHLPQK